MIVFTNKEFEKRIRKALAKPNGNIGVKELEAVEELVFEGTIDEDVKYLVHCHNLKILSAELKQEDLGIIRQLKNLESLELSIPSATYDCTFFEDMEKLKYLGMGGQLMEQINIANFSSLKSCKELREITVFEVENIDIHGIGEFPSLKTLFLEFISNIKGVEEISNIKTLEVLDICDIEVENMDFIKGLNSNVELDLCAIDSKEPIDIRIFDRFEKKDLTEIIRTW